MLFSIVIPTYHRNDMLAKCLDCLAPGRQTMPDGYEVIVTDNGSNPTAETMIRERYPWARWLAGPGTSPPANRNNGARNATGDWLVFLDDDCIPDASLLAAYSEAIAAQSGINVFEGRIYVDRPRRTLSEASPVNETGGYLWACNFAIRKSLFEALGGFDEKFAYVCMEDVDFRERLIERGEGFSFLKEAAVCHPWRPRRIPQEFRQYEATIPVFFAAHPDKRKDLTASYFLRVAYRLFFHETIPSLWRFHGSGFFAGLRHSLFSLRMAFKMMKERGRNLDRAAASPK